MHTFYNFISKFLFKTTELKLLHITIQYNFNSLIKIFSIPTNIKVLPLISKKKFKAVKFFLFFHIAISKPVMSSELKKKCF